MRHIVLRLDERLKKSNRLVKKWDRIERIKKNQEASREDTSVKRFSDNKEGSNAK